MSGSQRVTRLLRQPRTHASYLEESDESSPVRPARRLVRVSLSRLDGEDDDENTANDDEPTHEDILPTPNVSKLISEDSHPFLEPSHGDEATLPTQPLVASVSASPQIHLMTADTQPIGANKSQGPATQVFATPDTDDTQRLLDEAQRVLDTTQPTPSRLNGSFHGDRLSVHDQDTQLIPKSAVRIPIVTDSPIVEGSTQPESQTSLPPIANRYIADTQPINHSPDTLAINNSPETQPINGIADTQPITPSTNNLDTLPIAITNNITDTQPIGSTNDSPDTQAIQPPNYIADTQPIGSASPTSNRPTIGIADTQPIKPIDDVTDTQPITPARNHIADVSQPEVSTQDPDTLQDLLPYSPPLPSAGATYRSTGEPATDPDPVLPSREPRTDPDFVLPLGVVATTQDLSQGMILTLRNIPIIHEDSDEEQPSRKRLRSYIEVANTQLPPAHMTSDRPVYTQVVASDDEEEDEEELVPVPTAATIEDLIETHQRRTSPAKQKISLGPTPDLRRLTQNSQFQKIYALPEMPTPMELLPLVQPLLGPNSDLPSSPTRRGGPQANENAVWATWNIKLYPGLIKERGRHLLDVQFADGVYLIKNEDIYPLHLTVGDKIHTRSGVTPFIVTQLSYDTDNDDIVTIEGFNSVCIERNNGKTRSNLQQPRVVPLSQCWLDLGEWLVQHQAHSFAASMMLTNVTVSPIKALLRKNNQNVPPLMKPKTSQGLFAGTVFCFTFLDDDIREPLVEQVESNGGWYVPQDLHDFLEYHKGKFHVPDKCGTLKLAAVVARSYCRSAKYLEAVALGWPVVSDQYISDCVAEKAVIDDWPAYLLPAGELSALHKLVKLLDVYRFRLAYDAHQTLNENAAFNQTIMKGYTVVLIAHKVRNPELPLFMLRAFGAIVEFCTDLRKVTTYDPTHLLVYGEHDNQSTRRSKSKNPMITVGVIDWEWVVQTAISARMGPWTEISV